MRFVLATCVLMMTAACLSKPTYLRVATATPAQFDAATKLDSIWYEFQAGDVVPFDLLFFGALEGGQQSTPLRAKKPFYLVASKNQPMRLSFDGRSTSMQGLQSVLFVNPREDGQPGGQVLWMTYLGESRDPSVAMKELLESIPQPSSSQQSASQGELTGP